jgi:hypothetical protein
MARRWYQILANKRKPVSAAMLAAVGRTAGVTTSSAESPSALSSWTRAKVIDASVIGRRRPYPSAEMIDGSVCSLQPRTAAISTLA